MRRVSRILGMMVCTEGAVERWFSVRVLGALRWLRRAGCRFYGFDIRSLSIGARSWAGVSLRFRAALLLNLVATAAYVFGAVAWWVWMGSAGRFVG